MNKEMPFWCRPRFGRAAFWVFFAVVIAVSLVGYTKAVDGAHDAIDAVCSGFGKVHDVVIDERDLRARQLKICNPPRSGPKETKRVVGFRKIGR